jgi:hypothetical protein
MITLLNNRVKRGARQCSIIFNGFEKRLNMALATATAMVTAMGMVLIQMDILMRRNHAFL